MKPAPLAIAALFLSLAACSKDRGGEDGEEFRPPTVQARGDVSPQQERRFARLDRNTDGALTPDEYPARRGDRTAALDGNKDGKVSRSESIEGAISRFDAMDADHDGQVTPEERRAGRDAN